MIKDYEYYVNKVKEQSSYIKYVPREYKTKELCELAVHQDGYVIELIPKELRNINLYKQAVTGGFSLRYVPLEYKTPELCIIAVLNKNGNELQYVPSEYKTKELCLISVKDNVFSLAHVPIELQQEILDIISKEKEEEVEL